jgi:hypothetical protein
MYAILTGTAIRAGYPIDAPELTEIGGSPVCRADREGIEGFWTGQIAWAIGEIPIIAATWRKRYRLMTTPSIPIDVPDIPMPSA